MAELAESTTLERDAHAAGDAELSAPPLQKPRSRPRSRGAWRSWLRAAHRDIGYLLVGLTVVYALSGLAVNHLEDWNPNYVEFERTHQLDAPLPSTETETVNALRQTLRIEKEPTEVFRVAEDEIEVLFDERTLSVNLQTGVVREQGREARWFLRAANWLHLNRGKAAWTYVADAYAVLLLGLALSGLFMLGGRRGLRGRGAILTALGAAVPLLYVLWSGGP